MECKHGEELGALPPEGLLVPPPRESGGAALACSCLPATPGSDLEAEESLLCDPGLGRNANTHLVLLDERKGPPWESMR